MGHELDTTDGVVSFADSQNDAWHQLGQQVGHNMTPEEALEAAHMTGWDVRKVPLRVDLAPQRTDDGRLYDPAPEPILVDVPGKYTIVRTNPVTQRVEPLGVIGAWWTPFQNEATTKLLTDITEASGAPIETIGSLDGGRRTFVTMKMPSHLDMVAPNGFRDVTNLYLAVFNHHDGQGALRAVISPVRVVCANTQRIAESHAVSTVTIRHTGEALVRMEEVRRILGLTFKYDELYATAMAELAAKERDDVFVRGVLNEVFEADEADTERKRQARLDTAAKVMTIYRDDPTVNMWYGRAAGAYDAVTRYTDHAMPLGALKANTRSRGSESDRRALRTLSSTSIAEVKSRAFSLLMAN